MKLDGKLFIIIGIILLFGDGYLLVQNPELIQSSFGTLIFIAVAFLGIIFTGIGCTKYMNGQ